MSSLEPVYARAYDQATDFGIKSLTDAGDQAWTPSTPPPVTPPPYHMDFFPIRTATKDQMVLLTQHLETKKNWTMKEFLEPVYAQYHFVQEYYDSVHEAAFYLMKNTTVLPYPTNSKRFNKAYTGTFTRLGIPTRCCEFTFSQNVRYFISDTLVVSNSYSNRRGKIDSDSVQTGPKGSNPA